MHVTEKLYQEELKQLEREAEVAERLDRVNAQLHRYNWVFLHPYSQGMDIGILDRFLKEGSEEKIFALFARKFLDLNATITLVDGFYKKRPYLQDYGDTIEQSVILCLQKDFSGAISVLLPVIEGTLRKYLITKEGPGAAKSTQIKDLLKTSEYFKADYLKLKRHYLRQRFQHLIRSNEFFTQEQEETILEKEAQYFDVWIRQLTDYLNNNLYMNTRKGPVTDTFNRNIIFHGFDHPIEYSFRNYLRLINCVNFLSWVIGVTHENCSVLADVTEDEVRKKFVDYFRLLIISENLSETKQKILGSTSESFTPYLDKNYLSLISLTRYCLEPVFDATDIWDEHQRPRVKKKV